MPGAGRVGVIKSTALAVLATVALAGCSEPGTQSGPGTQSDYEPTLFEDRAQASGLHFEHANGMVGELYFAEMMGAGAALFDYDGDADLDVWLVQGGNLGADATPVNRADQLFRNDSADGQLRFTNVTQQAQIAATTYGMGVAIGDIDNDGDEDVFLSNFGPNQLWRNNGDGTFTDISASAGVGDTRWSVSASMADLDGDGWLDIYVGNYVSYTIAGHKPCRSTTSARDYCSPLVYRPQGDRLLRNAGDGRFEDVTGASGVGGARGGALGVSVADFNSDGRPDIYVANDGVANLLWINQGGMRFVEQAALAGVAVNMSGAPEASMGVDAGDFDDDGDEDLFMTHLARESNTLYLNDGKGWFEDRTVGMGLAGPSLAATGFGTGWFDYDNDGTLDIFAANGAVTRLQAQMDAGLAHPLRQRNQLFRGESGTGFVEVSATAGAAFQIEDVTRGAAFGDVDNDGDTDIVVTNNNGPARLLINQAGQQQVWLGLQLTSTQGRPALGARVRATLRGRGTVWRRARSDGSYGSSRDSRVLIGLGRGDAAQGAVEAIHVYWPNGGSEDFGALAPGRYHQLVQGQGRALQ